MEIIEQKINFKNNGNKNKKNFENQKDKDHKSLEKDANIVSNSKSRSKTKFKLNKKLQEHSINALRSFNFKNENSVCSNYFSKKKSNLNAKSDNDINKNNINPVNLKDNEFRPFGKTIKIINNRNTLNMKEKNENYYLMSNQDKENEEFNTNNKINTKLSKKCNRKNNKISMLKYQLIDKADKNISIIESSEENNPLQNNFEGLKHDEDKAYKNIFDQENSKGPLKSSQNNSNKNSKDNSFEDIIKVDNFEMRLLNNLSKVLIKENKLDKDNNKDSIIQMKINNNTINKNNLGNKKNVIFNDYNNNINKIINNHGNTHLKVSRGLSGKSDVIISNSLNNIINNNKNLSHLNEINKNNSNINENVFFEKVKMITENAKNKSSNKEINIIENNKIFTEKYNKMNSLSSNGFSYNNLNSMSNFNNNEKNKNSKNEVKSLSNNIDTKKLKNILIKDRLSKNIESKNNILDTKRLHILGTQGNSNEIIEEDRVSKAPYKNCTNNILNLNENINIKKDNILKYTEKENNNNYKSNKMISNLTKTYSTLAKKLRKNKEIKHNLECSSNSNFEILGCKIENKNPQEENNINSNILNNRNKSYVYNKNTEEIIKVNNIESGIINQNFNMVKSNINLKDTSNLNSNCQERHCSKEINSNNFNFENDFDKDNLNLEFLKNSRKNLLYKNNLFVTVNDNNFNTKTTKDTIKCSYYQNKNFSHIEIEGPEELHMLYINLNQQNKKLIYKFEKIDDTIKADRDNKSTVVTYENELEI